MGQDIFHEDYDDIWPTRMPSSTRRYHSDVSMEIGRAPADVQELPTDDRHNQYTGLRMDSQISVAPRRASAHMATTQNLARRVAVHTDEIMLPADDEAEREEARRKRTSLLLWLCVALCLMLLGWFVVNWVVNWWRILQDDWRYGRPRTYQVEAVVGHNDSTDNPSHFIALNLDRRIQVIELPGGDASKAKVYVGPTLMGPDQDLTPVTLTFEDLNNDGQKDLILHIQESRVVFLNDKDQFRTPHPDEQFSQ